MVKILVANTPGEMRAEVVDHLTRLRGLYDREAKSATTRREIARMEAARAAIGSALYDIENAFVMPKQEEKYPMSDTQPWKDRALAATQGSQFGAILRCAMGVERDATPRFEGKASITSDGYVMCDFVDRNGGAHMGSFVGDLGDLELNIRGLSRHLDLAVEDIEELNTLLLTTWIAQDYRP